MREKGHHRARNNWVTGGEQCYTHVRVIPSLIMGSHAPDPDCCLPRTLTSWLGDGGLCFPARPCMRLTFTQRLSSFCLVLHASVHPDESGEGEQCIMRPRPSPAWPPCTARPSRQQEACAPSHGLLIGNLVKVLPPSAQSPHDSRPHSPPSDDASHCCPPAKVAP